MQPQPVDPRGSKVAGPGPNPGWFVALFGLLFAAFGAPSIILQQADASALTGRATGTVVDQLATSGGWRPVVRFVTASGQPVRFGSNVASRPARFRVGDQVRVAYDPANPSHAAIDSFVDSLAIPLMFSGIGLIIFLFGLLIASGRLKPVPGHH
jgi:hypothetical protein